jgi:hypothetical protein
VPETARRPRQKILKPQVDTAPCLGKDRTRISPGLFVTALTPQAIVAEHAQRVPTRAWMAVD